MTMTHGRGLPRFCDDTRFRYVFYGPTLVFLHHIKRSADCGRAGFLV